MLDFTSALYLGLHHPSHSLRPWRSITTGRPAALGETATARQIARALAEVQSCDAAILAPSTLHLAWDLFWILAQKPITLHMDAGVYAITRWGVQRAAMRGAAVRLFPHHDAAALERNVASTPSGRASVVVTDGICPDCGRVAPLRKYLEVVRRHRGLLLIDDTQALGVLGHSPSEEHPYGRGGGGSLRWCGIRDENVIVFGSLAKGFGVPLAVLAGSHSRVREFEEKSLTRVHCSPPSIAALHAAERAITWNHAGSDAWRARLAALNRRFRRGLHALHHVLGNAGLFPVQTIHPPAGTTAAEFHLRLLDRGIRTVVQHSEQGRPCVSFLIHARHPVRAIDSAVAAVTAALPVRSSTFTFTRKEPHHEELIHH